MAAPFCHGSDTPPAQLRRSGRVSARCD
jgi:hypothetical protein